MGRSAKSRAGEEHPVDGSVAESPGFTSGDLARMLHVDLKTIHNWVNQGHIFGRRTKGRHLRFARTEVVRFMRRYGYAIPAEVGDLPPRVLVGRRHKLSGPGKNIDQTTTSGLFEVLLAAAAGHHEVVVLDLDGHQTAVIDELLAALRAWPFTRGIALVGISRQTVRRRRFVEQGGDVALGPQQTASLLPAIRWLVGGAANVPAGVDKAEEG